MKPVYLIAGLLVSMNLSAQESTPARPKAEATFDAGKVTIEYGSPAWKDAFAEQMKDGFVWRLGNNDPTSITMTCGLMATNGPVSPGSYKLALECASADEWNLLVYDASGFYEKGLPTWPVAKAKAMHDQKPGAAALQVKFDDKKQLVVSFGPHQATFTLQPVKANPPLETEFANVDCTINVLAVPITDAGIKNMDVGRAMVKREEMTMTWGLKLNVDGDKATLTFTNTRAATIATEQKQVEDSIGRMKGFLEKNPDQKERIAGFITKAEEHQKALAAEKQQLARLLPTKSFEATATARKEPTATLAFTSERPAGSVILKFGVKDKDYAFTVVPRSFMKPREE